MNADLDTFQFRLEAHFGEVAHSRQHLNMPVFALEHGLNADEISSLFLLLQQSLSNSGYRLSKHWLAWLVFATEQGYNYDGDEYWFTFSRRMPGWDNAWRPSIRTWFSKFNKQFNGIKPVGRWAEFFSIISWPITHALLPKDLQGQLARTLYMLRYNLVARLDQPVDELGKYVSRMTYGGSSRYENFLEQEALVGSIVLKLLGERSREGTIELLPSTLERIVQDLEKAGNARQWLRDTRRAIEVAQLRGAARLSTNGANSRGQQDPRSLEHKPRIRPTLLLRQTGESEWTPILEIPSFQEVADLTPELGEFLRTTRCAVEGSEGWRPPGWLLNGTQQRVINVWPRTDKPVLSFQMPNATMEHLLSSEACINAGPNWLFKVGSDGQAVELSNRLVRPGQAYIIVSRTAQPELSMATSAKIHCPGVTAIRFSLPMTLSGPQIDELKNAQLSVAETIRIWPAGLAARGWDGEGRTEWIESEFPCFAIEHDHPVAEYKLALNGAGSVNVLAKPPGVPTYIKLQPLAVGNHVLTVSIARTPSSAAIRPVEGIISLSVRPPSPWISGSIGHTGMIVSCSPTEPTLDEFWEGLVQLEVMGPHSRQIEVFVELMDSSGARLALERVGTLTMPLGEGSWQQAFSSFARLDKEPWNYLKAASGRVIVDGEELGVVHIPLQRHAAPVRWVWHHTKASTVLRLVDDHDSDTPLQLCFYSFERPLEPVNLAPASVIEGIQPDMPGGLFVAMYGNRTETLVVSARKVDGLRGLLVEPTFDTNEIDQAAAVDTISAIRMWSRARLTGALASERRNIVVDRLKEHLFFILCGPDWARAEMNFRLEKMSYEKALEGMLRCFDDDRTFGFIISRDARKYAHMAPHVRQREFASLAQRYSICPGATSKPALDLCDVINGHLEMSDAEVVLTIEQLWDYQALTAGARLIQLLGNRKDPFQLAVFHD